MNAVEIFVMSTLLSAFPFGDFTPAHISAMCCLKMVRRGRYNVIGGYRVTNLISSRKRGGKEIAKNATSRLSLAVFSAPQARSLLFDAGLMAVIVF